MMSMTRSIGLASLLALGLAALACGASPPNVHQLATADYGPYPENYEELAKERIGVTLLDPDSARYKLITRPVKAWAGDNDGYTIHHALSGSNPNVFGWKVCATYNSKNR